MITSNDKIMNSVNIISTMSFYGGKNVTEILNCLWTKAFAIFIFLHCLALLSAKIWLKILTGDQIMATFKRWFSFQGRSDQNRERENPTDLRMSRKTHLLKLNLSFVKSSQTHCTPVSFIIHFLSFVGSPWLEPIPQNQRKSEPAVLLAKGVEEQPKIKSYEVKHWSVVKLICFESISQQSFPQPRWPN